MPIVARTLPAAKSHRTIAFPFPERVSRVFSSRENLTTPDVSGTVRTREADATSQILASSRSPTDASVLPSGEKSTDQRVLEWPVSVARWDLVARSQIFTVKSLPADASNRPSGENATPYALPA